jgi:hypothetical protein
MHHKRRRPKHRRAGCLLCKPHKLPANGKADRRKANAGVVASEVALLDQEVEELRAEMRHYFADVD